MMMIIIIIMMTMIMIMMIITLVCVGEVLGLGSCSGSRYAEFGFATRFAAWGWPARARVRVPDVPSSGSGSRPFAEFEFAPSWRFVRTIFATRFDQPSPVGNRADPVDADGMWTCLQCSELQWPEPGAVALSRCSFLGGVGAVVL